MLSSPVLKRLLRAPLSVVLALLLAGAASAQTMVRLHTTQGPVDFRLLDTEAPRTVANFLTYVRSGAYADTFIHRVVTGFVVQGGGFAWPAGGYSGHITTNPPVANEFSAARTNSRGTVAMAKVGGNPDSATSEWFVNLANNAGVAPNGLDFQNGGFTVFARVTTPGMAVVDRIAALRIVSASPFDTLPVVDLTTNTIQRNNLVLLTAVTEFPPRASQTTSDRIFNYLEAAYPQYAPVAGAQAGEALGYVYRYYPQTNAYVGTKDGKVWYLVPAVDNNIHELADMAGLLSQAEAAGY